MGLGNLRHRRTLQKRTDVLDSPVVRPSRTLVALLAAEVVSSTGSAMTFVALPWFVLVTSGSPTRMSVVLAVEVLPMALFGIPSGSLVGRLGARTTMLVSDALRVPLILLVPALHWTGHLTFGLLLAIVFALGVFTAPYISAQRSIIPELFGDDEKTVSKASGLFGAATQLPIVIGPAAAGVLIALFGAPALLVVDGATFLLAFLVVLALVQAGRRLPVDDEHRGILAGVRYLAKDRLLGPMSLTLVLLDGASGAIAVAVPLLAFQPLPPRPACRGLDLHELRRRCAHWLGARGQAARPRLAASTGELRGPVRDAPALDRRTRRLMARRLSGSCRLRGSACRR
jgi:MFS family permease